MLRPHLRPSWGYFTASLNSCISVCRSERCSPKWDNTSAAELLSCLLSAFNTSSNSPTHCVRLYKHVTESTVSAGEDFQGRLHTHIPLEAATKSLSLAFQPATCTLPYWVLPRLQLGALHGIKVPLCTAPAWWMPLLLISLRSVSCSINDFSTQEK